MIRTYTTRVDDDDTAKKALCLAFVKSVLNDSVTERLLSDAVFEATDQMVGDCESALGTERVADAKAPLLFLLWSLPAYRLKWKTYEALREYLCRSSDDRRPSISFRHFLGSTVRAVARYIVDPLADLIEPWL